MTRALKLALLFLVFGLLCITYVFRSPLSFRAASSSQGQAEEDSTASWYARRMHVHAFDYLIRPSAPCPPNAFLGVFVSSALGNFQERRAIRETWGVPLNRNSTSNFLYFVLGSRNDSDLQDRLYEEAEWYGDLIQEDFEDTYLNLTLKSVMILKWISSYCPHVGFALKTDDDMFINTERLQSHLQSLKNKSGVLLGNLFVRASPIRKAESKWYVPRSAYPGRVFPNYLSGTGYVMSGDVAVKLYEVSNQVPLLHLEDIYITGMVAQKAGIKPTNMGLFMVNWKRLNRCQYKDYMTFHRVPPDDIRKMWVDVHNASLVCPTTKAKG